MSLFNNSSVRSLFVLCACLLTIVLLGITANVASFELGPDPYRIMSDRNRLEGMTARLDRRWRLDTSRRVYPEIKTGEISAERAPGGLGQGPRVTAILDRLRKEYEQRMNSGPANVIKQRLSDYSLLGNAAELTGPEQGLSMVDSPEPRFA